MPQDPNREKEYKIAQAVRNILLEDTYFIQEFTNKKDKKSFVIEDESLVFNLLDIYPKLAVYFDNEVEFIGQNNNQSKMVLGIDAGCQNEKKKIAKKESFMYLKDIIKTLKCTGNLRATVNGEIIQVAFSEVKEIEPTYWKQNGAIWTYISTMYLLVTVS